mgnify:CR=1 FL=1
MEELYKISNLYFSYKDREIIKNISFRVEKGEIIGILGPNGAGKSTLFNLLTGVLTNYLGDIYFNNLPIKGNEIKIKSMISAILDRSSTYDNMSVIANITYFCNIWDKDLSIGEKLLDDFELTSYSKFKVSQLSSGYKQRLKIVIALLNNPSVIFLDEPWLALDPVNSKFLTEKIKELNAKLNITFFIAAHDLVELECLCSQFIFIESGRIVLNFHKNTSDLFNIYTVSKEKIQDIQTLNLKNLLNLDNQQYMLINPSEQDLEELVIDNLKQTTLKELYFRILDSITKIDKI